MLDDVTAEVVALHEFFARWFNGAIPVEAFDREFVTVFDPGFEMVVPSGSLLAFERLCSGLMAAYGQSHGFAIGIREVQVIAAGEVTVVARYQELQRTSKHADATRNARWSTVVFDRDPSLRHGLRWRHVQETALSLTQLPQDAFGFLDGPS